MPQEIIPNVFNGIAETITNDFGIMFVAIHTAIISLRQSIPDILVQKGDAVHGCKYRIALTPKHLFPITLKRHDVCFPL